MITHMQPDQNPFKEVADLIEQIASRASSTFDNHLLPEVFAVYLAYELRLHGHYVVSNVRVPVHYEDVIIKQGFPMDLVVDEMILIQLVYTHHNDVDLKRQRFQKQLLLTGRPCGFLILLDKQAKPRVVQINPQMMKKPSIC